MFKTIVIAALGFAAVSAQFLDERNLQGAVAFTAAPAVNAATKAETGCNTEGYAITKYTTTGTAPAGSVPKAGLCVPTDFVGSSIAIGATTYTFTEITSSVVAPERIACEADAECGAGSCCTDVTLTAGTTAAPGTTTKKFCTTGAATTFGDSTYDAKSWLAGYVATVNAAVCTPSFGSYIKASVMVFVAVLSVALF